MYQPDMMQYLYDAIHIVCWYHREALQESNETKYTDDNK